MKHITLLTLLFLSTFTYGSITINSSQLDVIIIKNCALQSKEDLCTKKLDEIRSSLKPEELISTAPKLPIDDKIQLTVIRNPNEILANYYCLAIFNKIISMNQIGPDLFPYVVYGFSYSARSITSYKTWLKSKEASACVEALKNQGISPVINTLTKDYEIVLNPVTFLEDGAESDFFDTAIKNYNHERLHSIYAQEKAKLKVIKLWNSLSSGEKEQFKAEHPGYNFNNQDTLYKEFFSYLFEKSPEMAYTFIKDKKPKSYLEIKTAMCSWCLENNDEVLKKIKVKATLSPKDLIKEIENEKIKVLILSSGRKNPTNFFYWGQVRQDAGELNYISKIEGSMGKTLCKGEKAISQEQPTIVLASDSPYSTLIHEYLHILQIQLDSSWCPVSKRLWGNKPSAADSRMIRDREWDVRKVLWKLLDTPNFSLEDRIIVSEGLVTEGQMRGKYDKSATDFLVKNEISKYLARMVDEYKKQLTK